MTRMLRQELKELTRPLLELVFYAPEEAFCSYTETPDEDDISLFIDDESSRQYFGDNLSISGQAYRAIRVYEGAETLEVYGYINFLSASLAEAGIEVVYLGTFSADLLLVPEENIEQAFLLVSSSLDRLSVMRPPSPAILEVSSQRAGTSHLSDQSISMMYGSDVTEGADISLSKIPTQLQLVSIPKNELCRIAFFLLKVFLRADTSRFFSFTSVNGEITFVVEKVDLAILEESQVSYLTVLHTQWSVLQINAGSGGDAKNTVCTVSKILADHMIGIYYMSTFNFDFILTPSVKLEHAIQALLKSDPTITYN